MSDDDIMPFGAHRGKKMKNVPASYLHWFYHEGNGFPEVRQYIKDNMEAIKDEDDDLIWDDKD